MKISLTIIQLFLLIILVHSCSKENDLRHTIESEQNTEITDQGVAGERQKTVRDFVKWPCEYISDFKIYIDECFGNSLYVEALTLAIEQYNAIPNTSLNMSLTENEDDAMIIIDCSETDPAKFASTDAPKEFFKPQREINFNLDRSLTDPDIGCDSMNLCSHTFMMLHELGHAIGFAHDEAGFKPDQNGVSTQQYTSIIGEERDPDSVFNGGEAVAAGEANFGFCDLPCLLSENDILAIQEVYPECAPFVVQFEPCLNTIKIQAGNSKRLDNYSWSFDFSGLSNNPTISYGGTNNGLVTLHTQYAEGEEFCVRVQAEDSGMILTIPCDICYITPECDEGNPETITVTPSNACVGNSCPSGFTCVNGICCEDSNTNTGGSMCDNDGDCPPGFHCLFGDCCNEDGICL